MLLPIGSFILVLLITSYSVLFIYQQKEKMNVSFGTIITMVITLSASTAFNVVLAQAFSLKLNATIGVGFLFAAAIGYFAGRPFYMKAVINSVMVGFLGTMLGSVIGRMLIATNAVILITVTSLVIIMYVIQKIIDGNLAKTNTNKKNTKIFVNRQPRRSSYFSTILLSAAVIMLAAVIMMHQNDVIIGQIGQPQTQKAVLDEENELQEATIHITASGISPKDTQFEAGTMIKVIFIVESGAGSDLILDSEELGIHAPLFEGKNNIIINKPQPGKYEFMLESTSFKGTFTIK